MINFKDGVKPEQIADDLTQVDTQIGFMHDTLKRAVQSYQNHGLSDSRLSAMLEASVYVTQKTLLQMENTNHLIASQTLSKPIAVIYGVPFQLEESKHMDTNKAELSSVLNGLLFIISDVRITIARITSIIEQNNMVNAA